MPHLVSQKGLLVVAPELPIALSILPQPIVLLQTLYDAIPNEPILLNNVAHQVLQCAVIVILVCLNVTILVWVAAWALLQEVAVWVAVPLQEEARVAVVVHVVADEAGN